MAAESVCTVWLRLCGYRIVARRLRTPVGEIDIVARRRQTLAIVEVKARSNRRKALEAISRRQQKRLLRATQWLIAGRTDLAALQIRFDIMAVTPWRIPDHIIDAWRPESD
jgi:putative endonuclease